MHFSVDGLRTLVLEIVDRRGHRPPVLSRHQVEMPEMDSSQVTIQQFNPSITKMPRDPPV
jgi:hypothetical protein